MVVRTTNWRPTRVLLAVIVGGSLATGTAASAIAAEDPTTIRVAGGGGNLTGAATTTLAETQGYLAEAGITLEPVELEGRQEDALAAGEIDMAIVEPGALVALINDGNDFAAVAGTRCASSFYIAMKPEIQSVADLDGQQVIFGGQPGEPQVDLRVALFEAATGFDMDEVTPVYVGEPGQSDTWTDMFWNGDVQVVTFFARHRPMMEEVGAVIPVDIFLEWPSTYNVMRRDFIDANPEAVEGLVEALVRSQSYWLDPANKDAVIETMTGLGYDTERDINEFDEQKRNFCANMYLDPELHDRKLLQQGFTEDELLPIEDWAYSDALFQAQAALGLDNEPRGEDVTSLDELGS